MFLSAGGMGFYRIHFFSRARYRYFCNVKKYTPRNLKSASTRRFRETIPMERENRTRAQWFLFSAMPSSIYPSFNTLMNHPNLRPVIAILGPTASGKSAAAMVVAKHFDCEIISVDSAQVYRAMDIGTAKPSALQRQLVAHHLLDIRDPHESYSAADFSADAHSLITQIFQRDRVPLLVGGTMLYFRAFAHGLSNLPAANLPLRRELDTLAAQIGAKAMHDRLARVDPQAASRIHPNDPQRVQRALEIYYATGRTWSDWCAQNPARASPFSVARFVMAPQRRSWLHDRIAERFDQMLALGLVDEVAHLRTDPRLSLHNPALRSVGYRQLWQYLNGDIDFADARNRAITATRQLAKRQFTWLRREQEAQWFDSEDPRALELLLQSIGRVIHRD